MMRVTKVLTAASFAVAVGVVTLAATNPADAGPRGVRTVSGMDLGSGR